MQGYVFVFVFVLFFSVFISILILYLKVLKQKFLTLYWVNIDGPRTITQNRKPISHSV